MLNAIGLGYLSRGMWEANNGLDPRPALQEAAATIDKVVRANPNVDYGYNNLCVTWQTLAEYQIKRGHRPIGDDGARAAVVREGGGHRSRGRLDAAVARLRCSSTSPCGSASRGSIRRRSSSARA